MIALCKTKHIVHLNWLTSSLKEKTVLGSESYLLLSDKSAEKRYSFSMKSTLANGEIARQQGGILANWNVYICKKVAGNRAPEMKELKAIVVAAGGNIVRTIPKFERNQLLFVTSDPATQAQQAEYKSLEREVKVMTTTELFNCMITQTWNKEDKIEKVKNSRKCGKSERIEIHASSVSIRRRKLR